MRETYQRAAAERLLVDGDDAVPLEPLALAVVVALGHLHVARLVGDDVHAQPVVRGRVDRHRAHLAAPVLLGRAALLRGGHLGSDEKRKQRKQQAGFKNGECANRGTCENAKNATKRGSNITNLKSWVLCVTVLCATNADPNDSHF